MPRIPALPPGQWPPTMHDAVARLRPPKSPPANSSPPNSPPPNSPPSARQGKGRSKGLNVLGTMANHPDLANAFFAFNAHVLSATSLSDRHRELVVLRVAHLRRSEYEWRQHVFLAADAGIDSEDVARVTEGPDAPGWEALEGAMLRATDELVTNATVSDVTWEALAADLRTEQLMDLVFTVGTYDLLAMAFNAFGLELDDDLSAGASE